MSKAFLALALLLGLQGFARAQEWAPAGGTLKTNWTDSVTVENAWQAYPRPQLIRQDWVNLNGLWEYAITGQHDPQPRDFSGHILVPYAIESSLSGVAKPLQPEQTLWYRREFDLPAEWSDRRTVLHFGAVDFRSVVYVNGREAGRHEGGNVPFSFDITPYLKDGRQQEVVVSVWDPTDTDIQPRGKQTLDPRGFWYTAVSGIWQTVWLEPVAATRIDGIEAVTQVQSGQVKLNATLVGETDGTVTEVRVFDKGKALLERSFAADEPVAFTMSDFSPWTPDNPRLYDLEVRLLRGSEELDRVTSYFAMREITAQTDSLGFTKLYLNGKELFHWGTLDQGWWPDGLLTPPTEAAMVYDMEVVKSLGFNMIRKHIKVEPARYYYHADRLGLMLWQDMPTGFLSINHPEQHVAADSEADWDRPEASARQFRAEWKSIIDHLRFFPSIVVWVPFNEGWGQFDSEAVTEWTMAYDTTRLVDGISGWADRGVGHFYDAHQYPGPGMEPPADHPGRAVVLGEFGGLGHPVPGHLWNESRRNWGYRTYTDKPTFLNEYARAVYNLYPERARGLAAAIYTQTSDVEAEVNGLLTYDRKVLKVPGEWARILHAPLFRSPRQRAVFVLRDGETTQQERAVAAGSASDGRWLDPEQAEPDFVPTALPTPLSASDTLRSRATFSIDELPANLALKFYGDGDVTVYLNGQCVLSKYLRTKRHYDDINLSTHVGLLRTGSNSIAIEVAAGEQATEFDYGLYTF